MHKLSSFHTVESSTYAQLFFLQFDSLGWHELGVQECHGKEEVGVPVLF